jgi:hypothetical protein
MKIHKFHDSFFPRYFGVTTQGFMGYMGSCRVSLGPMQSKSIVKNNFPSALRKVLLGISGIFYTPQNVGEKSLVS